MDAAKGTRARAVRALQCAVLLVAAISLTGCVLGEPDVPLGEDPIPAPVPPSSAVPTSPPGSPDILSASGVLGEPLSAGPWRVELLDAEPVADDRLRVLIELSNTSQDTLRFTPGDFTLTTGEGSVFPSAGVAHDLDAVRDVSPGEPLSLTGFFDGVPNADDAVATLVFAPAEGGPVRIEIEVTVP